jgi:predicted NUDIX family phosphoesterase
MQEILVIPRECIHGFEGFVPWIEASELIDTVPDLVNWMPRKSAELSERWVQPIPCAIFRNSASQYCVFRQARQSRIDLSGRISFFVGGHIDSNHDNKPLREVFAETAKREISEELGIVSDYQLKPIGIVIDSSTTIASRHIGLVYETTIDQKLKSLSADEFSIWSKHNGQFYSVESLSQQLHSEFDPWSSILFSQYLNGKVSMDVGRQSRLSMSLE